jgi:hypothetical protein
MDLEDLLTMLAVDLSSHGAKLPLEFLIFFDVFAARNGDLNEDNLVLQLRMIIKECIEALELLGQAFDMIKSVDSNYDLDAFVAFFQVANTILNLGFLQSVGEFLRVDTDNELIRADKAVFILYLIWDLSTCTADGQ